MQKLVFTLSLLLLPLLVAADWRAPATPATSNTAPAPAWQPVLRRLAADGLDTPQVRAWFARLPEAVSQDPMGRKVLELYTRAFIPPVVDPDAPKLPKPRVYKNVITDENIAKCRAFLQEHAPAFALAELRYGVPKEVAAALLFVETRLGTYLGREGAFYTLASMASTTKPDDINGWFDQLPGYEEHLDWMAQLMPKRADWAYRELRALVRHGLNSGVDIVDMPGSIYGAIGICQFMPSNLAPYGADGDGDGIVDLFNVQDAVASLSNFLVKHGWKQGMARPQQHKVLKRYNNADIYANTILTLAESIAAVKRAQPAPPAKKSLPGAKEPSSF